MKISDFPLRGSMSLPISQSVLEEQSCLPSKPPSKNVIALLSVSFSFGIAPPPTLPFKNQIFVIRERSVKLTLFWGNLFLGDMPSKPRSTKALMRLTSTTEYRILDVTFIFPPSTYSHEKPAWDLRQSVWIAGDVRALLHKSGGSLASVSQPSWAPGSVRAGRMIWFCLSSWS